MMLAISFLSVDSINVVLLVSCGRLCDLIFNTFILFSLIFYTLLHSFSYRGKVIIKGIILTDYSITIIKGKYGRYTRFYSFQRNKGCDFFSCVHNILSISFKIFIKIIMFTFFVRVDSKFLYFMYLVRNCSFGVGSFLLIKFVSNLFYTDIDLCKLKVIQGLGLNFNLY